jgi:hypothetical protein
MNGDSDQRLTVSGSEVSSLAPEIHAALAQLRRACDYARDVSCDPWEFAVEIGRLLSVGVTTSDLRWLVKRGVVEHASEVTKIGDDVRKFHKSANLAFGERSCFLLADAVANMAAAEANPGYLSMTSSAVAGPDVTKMVSAPRWSQEDRTLYLGPRVVKEYRVPSPNQELVLKAFQEEGWPRCVDDPLPPADDKSPKQRLRDTIRCLNASQRNHLIRFRGNGTGEGVRWELVADLAIGVPENASPPPAGPGPLKRAA